MNPPPEPSPPTTLRLTSADFDAYSPERGDAPKDLGASVRARQELGLRMFGWARGVVARLAEIGIFVEAVAHPSIERGGRHVTGQRILFLLCQAGAETFGSPPTVPRRGRSVVRRAHLTLAIDAVHVEVAIEVPPEAALDLYNLRALLRDPARAHELTGALESLPEQFTLATFADARAERTFDLRQGQLAMAELAALDDRVKRLVWIGWNVPRELATKHSELLDEQLEDAIVALGPAFKLIAWAPDNDLTTSESEVSSRRERRDTRRAKRRARAESVAPHEGEPAARPRRSEAQDKKHKAKIVQPSRPLLRATLRDGPRIPFARAPRPEVAPARLAQQGAVGRPPIRRPMAGGFDPHAPIEKGARVRVLAGPFAGKVGFVQELDGKGRARVMLGLLATRVEVKNLVACTEGRERPPLMSSHRRPLPAR
jgi:hypothetical protein